MMNRKQNFQTISWFNDLYRRRLLDLDPPYQRRSIWNQVFKDYFIDTILLGYPSPAIFLYEEIDPDGHAVYHVVDGKQRLTAIFEFVAGEYPVYDGTSRKELAGKYFKDLGDDTKQGFWGYQFSVEYVPSRDEGVITNIFDRINRNTARLTAQELRHAKLSGVFIKAAEALSDWMEDTLPPNFPYITSQSRKQMKDVELVGHLLLLLEVGPRGYSTAQLDEEFTSRDTDWDARRDVVRRFRKVTTAISEMLETPRGSNLVRSRLRNQADFYSLFGAFDEILSAGRKLDASQVAVRISKFLALVEDEKKRQRTKNASEYYEAARSASNDLGPRKKRISTMINVISGE